MDAHLSTNLQVESLVVGELSTNCYLVWCPETFDCLIIDPADSGTAIVETVLQKQLNPVAIILTHGHFDHVLGLLEVQLAFDIPSYMHPADDFLLGRAQSSATHWLKHEVDPVPPATAQLKDQQLITIGNHQLRVLHTPGHTPGSVCLSSFLGTENNQSSEHENYSKESILICGDRLFKDGVGRTDFAYGKTMQLFASIDMLKGTLPNTTFCYPGHGEGFYLVDRLGSTATSQDVVEPGV